jgi:plasmid maintenance system antidote protein VapI
VSIFERHGGDVYHVEIVGYHRVMMMNRNKHLDLTTWGEIFREYFTEAQNIGINQIARAFSIHPDRICEIVNGKRPMTA